MQCCYSLVQIKNQMKCLRQHNAIECLRWKITALSQIANQGCARIIRADMQHVAVCHSSATVLHGVGTVSDLQDPPFDVIRLTRQEILDIATVDRLAPIVAEVWADRAQSP